MATSYQDAGVDWKKGDKFVSGIRGLVERTYGKEVVQGIGGFAGLYDIGGGRYLASGTDGVGTKLKIAQALNSHDTIGIDLVAMCVNDILCCGARPMFFLDYVVCERLDVEITTAIVKGISDGCVEAGMALIGGETAEHPGCFPENEYDLSGFCVGEVSKDSLVDGSDVKPGDDIVGLASSGVHSNGFSLIRKLIKPEEKELMSQILVPTKIYVRPILSAMSKFKLKGMAHVTGSAFNKVTRINAKVGFDFDGLPDPSPLFQTLQERSGLDVKEMYSTFNMGVGLVVVTSDGPGLVKHLEAEGAAASVVGKTTDSAGCVRIKHGNSWIDLKR